MDQEEEETASDDDDDGDNVEVQMSMTGWRCRFVALLLPYQKEGWETSLE